MSAVVVSILCSLHVSNSLTQYFVSATVFAGTALSRARSISSSVFGGAKRDIAPDWVGLV